MIKERKILGGIAILLICNMLLSGCNLSSYMRNNPGSVTTNTSQEKSTEEKTDNTPNKLSIDTDNVNDKIDEITDVINEKFYFDTDDQNVEDYLYKGILAGLDDPYSAYYTPEELNELMQENQGIYYGIGVSVTQDVDTNIITFVRVFKDSPAAEAGLKEGDKLVKVDDEDITEDKLELVVSKIKGEEGTTVRLTIAREGESDYLDLDVERRKIEFPSVEYKMLENNIGYVLVTDFYEVTTEQYINAVEDLKSQGMEGLIVDLRNNPGGLVDTVCNMLDYMLPAGTLVYTEDKEGNILDEYTSTDEQQFDLPLAVLVNGYSASASEIFTGAIKDYSAGTIIGTQTYGKGIVQSFYLLSDGSAVKLTIAKYFTPNGNDIHKIGITPDIVVEYEKPEEGHEDVDNQLDAAIENIKEQMSK